MRTDAGTASATQIHEQHQHQPHYQREHSLLPPAPGTKLGPEVLCPAVVLVAVPAEVLVLVVLPVLPEAGELWEVCGAHGLGSGSLFSVREG